MLLVRRGVVLLLSLILFISLVGAVAKLGFNTTLDSPKKLETYLSQSKIYDKLASAVLDQSEEDAKKNGNASSVSLTNPEVKKAAEQTFSADFIEQNVNKFIEANYDWLNGKTQKPSFTLDFTATKQKFSDSVGTMVTERLTALPVCNVEQQKQLQIPVDPLTVQCRPSGIDPKTEGNRVAEEVKSNPDFLGQPNLTADTIGRDDHQNEQPYYQKLSAVRTAYQVGQKLLLILTALAILSILGILFIAPTRRRGLRRLGWVFTFAGLALIFTKLAGDALVAKVKAAALKGNLGNQLDQPASDVLTKIESQMTQHNLWFGIAFLVIGLVVFIWLINTREARAKKPGLSSAPSASRVAEENETEPAPQGQNPTPQPMPPRPVSNLSTGDIKDRMRRPTPTGPPAVGSSSPQSSQPARPKRPKLIQ